MKCEYDHEIILKALNLLHRAILLDDRSNQELHIENLVQLVRYFARKSSRSTLVEELENLERAVNVLIAGGEIKNCHFPNRDAPYLTGHVERFSVFSTCIVAINEGAREGKRSFGIQYDAREAQLAVKVMD